MSYEPPPVVPGNPGTEPYVIPTPSEPPPGAHARRKPMPSWAIVAICVFVAVGVAGATVGASLLYRASKSGGLDVAGVTLPAKSPFERVKEQCDPSGKGTVIADKGKTLLIDNRGEEDFSGVDLSTLLCLVGALDVPVAVKERMFATRALDGRQEGKWGDFEASWAYHPNEGLDLIVTLAT